MSQAKRFHIVDAALLIAEIALLPALLLIALVVSLAACVRRRAINWLGGPHGHF